MQQVIVAIPVKNELALIGDCLRALALQQGSHRPEILLLVNNSGDGTAELARSLRPTLPCKLHVIEHEFPPSQASAGHARRLAMERAAALGGPDSLLITSDADSCVAPNWLEATLAAFEAGADVVCGRAVIDPIDAQAIPKHLHEDDRQEVSYGACLDRLAALLDPDPADPVPRHSEESGASIAVRRSVFLEAGGVPAIPSGEDRAFVDALRRVDARIRHAPEVIVTVSGRTVGRARDGMADTIRRRIVRQDLTIDGSLEPVADRVLRIGARRLLRLAWHHPQKRRDLVAQLAADLTLAADQLDGWLALPHFGAVWALVEAASPALVKRAVKRAELGVQSAVAWEVLSSLEPGPIAIPSRPRKMAPGTTQPSSLRPPDHSPPDCSPPDCSPPDWAPPDRPPALT